MSNISLKHKNKKQGGFDMKKVVYNIFSIIIAIALVAFMGYCWNDFVRFGLNETLIYLVMSAVSVVIVLANLFVGGKKHEAKH